jgi:hypothetical protein
MTSRLRGTTLVAGLVALLTSACASGGGKGGAAGNTGTAGAGSAGATAGAGTTGAGGTTGTAGAAGATGTAGGGGSSGTAGSAGSTGAGSAGHDGGAGTGAAGSDAGALDAPKDTAPRSCVGHALSLAANGSGHDSDAAHSRVQMELLTDLPIGNANRTIEFWMYVKPTDWVAEINEIYVYGTVGTLQQVGLDFGMPAVKGMPTNHATLGPYTDGFYDDDTGVYLGLDSAKSQWVHAAMTWDGTTLRTYVNGALKIMTTVAGKKLLTTASPFTMGCNPPYFGCFNGLVDELRLWNVARTDAEILGAFDKGLVGNEAGLVGYWKFDEAPGVTTAADSVTTAGHTPHPGTLLAATDAGLPTFVTPEPPPPVACP